MPINRWDGAVWTPLTILRRWNGTTWVDITLARRWDGTSWVDITLPGGGGLSVSVNRTSFGQSLPAGISDPSVIVMSDGSAVVTATGGVGAGPTYSWTRISGSFGISATAPTAATTSFSANVSKNNTEEGTWKCTVVRGVETKEVQVDISFTYGTPP